MARIDSTHRLVLWLVDHNVEPFDQPVEWFSNGERGHLHAGRYCTKILRSTNLVTHELTPDQARNKRTVCQECFREVGRHSDEHNAVRTWAGPLVELEERIDTVDALQMSGLAFAEIDRLLRSVVLRDLKTAHAAIIVPEQHESLYRATGDRIDGLADRYRPDPVRLAEDLVIAASIESIEDALNNRRCEPWWGGTKLTRLFSSQRLIASPLNDVFKVWRPLVASLGPTAALGATLDALRPDLAKWLVSIEQLEVLGPLEPRPGEHAQDTVRRAFGDYVEEALTAVLSSWTDRIVENLADQRQVVFAVNDRWGELLTETAPAGRLDLLLLRSANTAIHGTKLAAVLTRPIAQWVQHRGQDRRLYGEIADIGPGGPEQIETALALWQPGSGETLSDFGAAYTAALSL